MLEKLFELPRDNSNNRRKVTTMCPPEPVTEGGLSDLV
jgi:hypothetical protein